MLGASSLVKIAWSGLAPSVLFGPQRYILYISLFSSLQESELAELRETIEMLKTQNTDAQTAIQVALNGPDHLHKGKEETGMGRRTSCSKNWSKCWKHFYPDWKQNFGTFYLTLNPPDNQKRNLILKDYLLMCISSLKLCSQTNCSHPNNKKHV